MLWRDNIFTFQQKQNKITKKKKNRDCAVDICRPSQGGSSVFGSLMILDMVCCYLWLFSLYINIKIGEIVVKC